MSAAFSYWHRPTRTCVLFAKQSRALPPALQRGRSSLIPCHWPSSWPRDANLSVPSGFLISSLILPACLTNRPLPPRNPLCHVAVVPFWRNWFRADSAATEPPSILCLSLYRSPASALTCCAPPHSSHERAACMLLHPVPIYLSDPPFAAGPSPLQGR